jgi:hypothetical protein
VLLPVLVAAVLCLALPSVAAAQACPAFDGVMSFPEIHSSEDPEDYCWEMTLNEGQELRQVSDQQIAVVSKTGAEAWTINAPPAHDAEGVSVPTTVTVTGETEFTLTVHHRAGNPAAGGAPFYYPIVHGVGYEGGFTTVVGTLAPTEQAPPVDEGPAPTCEVPVLQGRTLRAARRALLLAGCQLGPVRGHRNRAARVVKQYRPAFRVLPVGTAVGVKLAR